MKANLTVSQKVILYFLYEATAGKKDRVANSDKGAWVKFTPASCKIYSNLKQVACLPEALAPVQTWPASVKLRASISADGTYDWSSSWNSDSVSLFQLWLEINAAVLGTAAAGCVDFSLFSMFYFQTKLYTFSTFCFRRKNTRTSYGICYHRNRSMAPCL